MKIPIVLPAVCGLLLVFAVAAAESTNSPATAPAEKTKPCFQCQGTGEMKCPVRSCVHGQADCPGPCLKLSKGVWRHMNVAGHPPTDWWITFHAADGGTSSWNQNHVGDVIQIQNGSPVDTGPCKVCGGTGHVTCSVCKGTGEVTCSVCEGRKVVPESWSAFDYPRMKNRPSRFQLKDGRVLIGRRSMVIGSSVTIRTEKENVEVDAADIVSEEKQPTAE